MTTSNRGRRPGFTPEYICQALDLADRIGAASAAKELGIAANNIYRWRKKREQEGSDAFRGHGKMTAEMEEIVRLRRENARLKEERDILKKAATFFASEKE